MQDRVFRTVPIAVRKKRSAARFRVGLCQVPGGKGSPRLKECYKQNLTKFAWERYFLNLNVPRMWNVSIQIRLLYRNIKYIPRDIYIYMHIYIYISLSLSLSISPGCFDMENLFQADT